MRPLLRLVLLRPASVWSASVSVPIAALSQPPLPLQRAAYARAHVLNPVPAPLLLPPWPRGVFPLSKNLRRGSSVPAASVESPSGEAPRTPFPACSSLESSLHLYAGPCGVAPARVADPWLPPTLGNPRAIPILWPVAQPSRSARSRGANPPWTDSDLRSFFPTSWSRWVPVLRCTPVIYREDPRASHK